MWHRDSIGIQGSFYRTGIDSHFLQFRKGKERSSPLSGIFQLTAAFPSSFSPYFEYIFTSPSISLLFVFTVRFVHYILDTILGNNVMIPNLKYSYVFQQKLCYLLEVYGCIFRISPAEPEFSQLFLLTH